jgi:hypothetical protein
MTRARYDIGDQVRLDAFFFSDAELTLPGDPTEITFRLRKPDGSLITAKFGVGSTVVREDVGVYYALANLDQDGHWHYRWEGTGAITSAEDGEFYVPPSAVFGSRR